MLNDKNTEPILKNNFIIDTIHKAIGDVKIASIAASIAFFVFGFLDCFVYPKLLIKFIFIRAAVIVISLLIFYLIKTPYGKKYPRLLGMAEYFLCCFAIEAMIMFADGYLSPYYAGINLVLIVFIFILPMDVKRTSLICGIVYLVYLMIIFANQKITNLSILINNNAFLLATMLLVSISSYFATHKRFNDFSLRFNLSQTNFQLEQAYEKLRELDTQKARFMANVNHELRTPLAIVLAVTQLFYNNDMGPLTTEQHAGAYKMYRAALKLMDMINQMLDFSRFEAGRMQVRLRKVNIDEYLQDMVTQFSEITAQHKDRDKESVVMRYAKEGDVPTMYIDKDLLDSTIMNLLRNAIKFTKRGSIFVRVKVANNRLIIVIEDTGIGIPPEHIPFIFERFKQVDSSSTREYQGTGLGLTIVKESVEIQHGAIKVDSKFGQGTTFTVEFPLNIEELLIDAFIDKRDEEDRRKEKAIFGGEDQRKNFRRTGDVVKINMRDIVFMEKKEDMADADETQIFKGIESLGKILVVEDSDDLRALMVKMLKKNGYEVIEAPDGSVGYGLAQKELPDVVVSDVMMPKMDGHGLIKAMRFNEKTNHIPIILLSVKAGEEAKIEGLEKGADDYIPKPANPAELLARITNLIRKHKNMQIDAINKQRNEEDMLLADVMEMRDLTTAGHSREVLKYGTILAQESGIPVTWELRIALMHHDIGKIKIPDSILLKDKKLTEEEWVIMRKHPIYGEELLKKYETFKPIARYVRSHQEKYDGTGYPDKLNGKDIPEISRIIAVADTYHVITNKRPYKDAMPPYLAIRELLRCKGTYFDPELVDALVRGLLKHNIITEQDITDAINDQIL